MTQKSCKVKSNEKVKRGGLSSSRLVCGPVSINLVFRSILPHFLHFLLFAAYCHTFYTILTRTLEKNFFFFKISSVFQNMEVPAPLLVKDSSLAPSRQFLHAMAKISKLKQMVNGHITLLLPMFIAKVYCLHLLPMFIAYDYCFCVLPMIIVLVIA